MQDSTDSNEATCTDEPLSPEAHDLEEIDQTLLLELDACAVYAVTSRCTRDGCDSEWSSAKIIGQKPKTKQEFRSVVYQLYESFWENPRNISHLVMIRLVPVSDTGARHALASHLSEAVDLGCRDADSGDKKSRNQVLDWVLPDDF